MVTKDATQNEEHQRRLTTPHGRPQGVKTTRKNGTPASTQHTDHFLLIPFRQDAPLRGRNKIDRQQRRTVLWSGLSAQPERRTAPHAPSSGTISAARPRLLP